MFNLQKEKTKMPHLKGDIRNKNFSEVALGYTLEMAQNEANRCLGCKHHPCISACPVNVNIPAFIDYVKKGEIDNALHEIKLNNNFPSICGRVCPQEAQCESKCVRGIKDEPVAIGRLERFVGDNGHVKLSTVTDVKEKVAIVGSGPASLSCATDLAQNGYQVTIFEALHLPGGVLSYGIPEFRLPKEIVKKEIDSLKQLNVEIECNTVIGKTLSFADLWDEGYKAIFIGSGAGLPRFMNIENENAAGVVSANEFLTRCNLMKAYLPDYDTPIYRPKNCVIVGGGNVAMDACRVAKRLGANTKIIYRRSLAEMPARNEEIEHAQEEGIEFELLANPVKILVDEKGAVKGIECVKMELLATDDSKRKQVRVIENSNFIIECDCVIMAIGTLSNPLLKNSENELQCNNYGNIIVNEDLMTSIDNVYAGGDAVSGAATVIKAMGAGKKAAQSIMEQLSTRR